MALRLTLRTLLAYLDDTLQPAEIKEIGQKVTESDAAQELIARYERSRAIETLPVLLAKHKDRDRLLTLLERVLADTRVQRIQPSAEQVATLARIREVLGWVGRADRPGESCRARRQPHDGGTRPGHAALRLFPHGDALHSERDSPGARDAVWRRLRVRGDLVRA